MNEAIHWSHNEDELAVFVSALKIVVDPNVFEVTEA